MKSSIKSNWLSIRPHFNRGGLHEGVPVIVWNVKSNLPEITAFYSSCPNNLFSDGTYTHFMVAPKNPI